MGQAGERRRLAAGAAAALLVAATLAAAFTLVFGSGSADAKPEFLAAWGTRYPGAAGSRIATCLLCHRLEQEGEETEYRMNPYGRAAGEAHLDFARIEGLDSDGDGYSNLQEIGALTFPGNSADNPATVSTTTTVPGATTTTAAPGSGGALYAANCAGCHGAAGGNLVPTALSRSQLVSVIGTGRSGMPGFSSRLSAAEIGSIADALLGWSQTTTTRPPGATTTAAPGPVSGAAVYSSFCSGCHGANGGNLAGRGLSASRIAGVVASGTAGMPSFRATLSSAQINALASWLASAGGSATTTTTAAPGPVSGAAVYSSSCAGCHGANGGNLAGRGLSASRIAGVVASGTAGMPSFRTTLSSAQINALASWLASAGGTTATGSSAPSAAPLAGGAALYRVNCSGCHGDGSSLAALGLSASGLAAATASGSGAMPGFGGILGDSEIDAIVGYLASLGGGGAPATTAGVGPADGSTDGGGSAGEPAGSGSGDPTAALLPGIHGALQEGGDSWARVAVAAVLALGAGLGAGLLLVRSARRVFRA